MSTPQDTPPVATDGTDDPGDASAENVPTPIWPRLAVWGALVAGSAVVLLAVSLSTVSYRYSTFLQRTFREVESHRIPAIWAEQVASLPLFASEQLTTGLFMVAILVVLAAVLYGAWLLLVSSAREGDDSARPGMRAHRAR